MKLSTRLKALETKVHEPTTLDLAQQLAPTLKSLDAQFKDQHFSIIDTIDESDSDSLAKEQEVLDNHDEESSVLLLRIQQLIQKCSSASDSGSRKVTSRSLTDLEGRLLSMETAFATLSGKPEEAHLYYHYQKQLQDFKGELGVIRQNILSMGIDSTEELSEMIKRLDKKIFDVSIRIK